MSDITLSKAVRSNLLNLQSTAELLGKSQERLSTGLRVNSALDNPTNFFTAQGLNSRANDLNQLLDSVSNAVQTVAAADKGISAITKLVQSAQATARQALQTAATVSATAAVPATTSTSNTTSLSIVADVNGANASTATSNLTSTTITGGSSEVLASDATSNLTAVTITGGSSEVLASASTTDISALTATGGTITVNGQNVVIGAGDAASDVLTALQGAAAAATGSNAFTVADNADGTYTLTGATGNDLAIGGDATTLNELGLTSGTVSNQPAVTSNAGTITINGQNVALADGDDATAILGKLQTAATASSGANAFTVSNASGVISITGASGNDLTIGGNAATLSAVGLSSGTTTNQPAVTSNAGTITINGQNVALADGDDSSAILGKLQTAATASSGSNAFTVSNASGVVTITGATGNSVAIGGNAASLTAVGLTSGTTPPVVAQDNNAGSITINGQAITLAGGDDSAAVVGKLQAAAAASSGANQFTVSNTGGVLTLTGANGNDLVVSGDASSLSAVGLSAGTIDGTPAVSGGANPKRAELVSTYNDLLGQIDALAKDASFNGVNLLNGDNLSVLFNEDGSSKLDISGVTNTATGLGLNSLGTSAFDTNASINSTLDDLKGAIDTLRTQAGKFGSNLSVVQTRQDFTKQMINVLQTGASNLTLADTNEEAANVLALQTRQQLSSTALSLASQADQNVLRLF